MIRYLAIRNLAVLEAVTVEFEQSFNILTGETGAGKSILVEAVGLLLGGRATPDLIRTGADIASVEAIFDEPDGTEVIVRREITNQGRSRAFINGALATAAALRDLSQRLVEMHGQHEHQLLLDPARHLPLLDASANLIAAAENVAKAFAQVQTIRGRIDRLRMDDRERAARLELVAFQLTELDKAAPRAGEDEELSTTRQVLRNADRLARLCAESYAELYDSEGSALTSLGRVWKRVEELGDIEPRFAAYAGARADIKAQLDDLALTLRDFGESLDNSPERLQEAEDRLALLERLKRKHGPSLDEVIAAWEALKQEQALLTGADAGAADLDRALTDASSAFLSQATALSARRVEAAKRFARSLETELASLAMERTRFEVRLKTNEAPEHWTAQGIDEGEFFLSPNPGEDLKPLVRIASGGELSRVMLALKMLGTADATGRTLIFDEVDAGIGGRVASVVGEKLRGLGQKFQVLCITHLPQIAAAGATHFHIEKHVDRNRTTTSVRKLDEESRVEELARMIGGKEAGVQARAGARELLTAARSTGELKAKAKGENVAGRKRK